jgi:hypothetical protein
MGRSERWPAASSDRSEERIVADRCHQTLRKPGGRAAAQGKAEVKDEQIEPPGSPGPRGDGTVAKPLGEYSAFAACDVASKSPRPQYEPHRPPA